MPSCSIALYINYITSNVFHQQVSQTTECRMSKLTKNWEIHTLIS